MTKLTSASKRVRAQNQNQTTTTTMMISWLTKPELDAADQLIQLSGYSTAADSSRSKDNNFHDLKIPEGKDIEAESVGEAVSSVATALINDENNHPLSSSSAAITTIDAENLDVCEEIEVGSPRKRKFRSILDLYSKTKPLVKEDEAAMITTTSNSR